MTDSSLSLASNSISSEFHVLTEVDPNLMYGRSKLTEESIAKLRSKIETQKRKVSDCSTSSFISSQADTPPYYSSTRKVASLRTTAPPPSHSHNQTHLEIPSRKIAPSDPSLTEETRPKRIIGKTDPTLPLSNIQTKPAVWRPQTLEKPKQKCALAARPAHITPYSWRRGHAIASQLLRPKSLSEGSLSSSTTSPSPAAQTALSPDEHAYDSRLRLILQESCLNSLERDSLDFETESDVNPGLEQRPPSLPPEPMSPSLSQSAPNLKKSEAPGTARGCSRGPKVPPTPAAPLEPPTPPRIRHYERKNIQQYIRRQKESRKERLLLEVEEKTRIRDVKNQRLQDLYLRQKCKLSNNLMLSKAKLLHIPASYFSPISSETFVRNTPVDFTQIESVGELDEDSLSEASHPFETAQQNEEVSDPIQPPPTPPVITESPPFPDTTQLAVLRPRTDMCLSLPPAEDPLSPLLPPPRSHRVENIRIAALALREKLDEEYQKAERELAATILPGAPSYGDLSPRVLRRAAFETESPAALSIEASNEERNSRIQAESSEDAFPLPDSLAPVFLTKKEQGAAVSRERSPEVRYLSQTDWQARSDGDPMSAINIYVRKHLGSTKPHSPMGTGAAAVQTSSPEKQHQGVDTLSLRNDLTNTDNTNTVQSPSKRDSKPNSSAVKRHLRYKHKKTQQQQQQQQRHVGIEEGVTEGDVLESQMKQELQLFETLEKAERELIKVERITSQLSSTDLVSEYQTKVARQKSFFEEQIKLLATRMQMETAKPRDFHQLSPLTETTEPEFGERADAEEGLDSPPRRQIEEAREKNRSSADHLTQEINRTREEATKALIEMSKHRIDSDQTVTTSTPSIASHALPPETAHTGIVPITYSEDFNSESIRSIQDLSYHSGSGTPNNYISHPISESYEDRLLELVTNITPTAAPARQLSPPGAAVNEDSMFSISDMSVAYASETELMHYEEDRIFQMLLPSKSHRRHSNRSSPSKQHSRHDTSTDSESFLVSPPQTHSKSKEEESFQTFLDHMVTSFLKKDLERKKHQSMLLELRENAIEERTHMQLRWLQMVSKKSEHKARDLKMPQLQKLKREILTRHEREYEEVKKLKENLSSNRESAFIKKQQKFIKELRQSTQHIKDRIDRMTPGHSLIMDDSPNHSSIDATSSIQEQLLCDPSHSRSQTRPSSASRLETPRSLVDLTSDDKGQSPVPRVKSLASHPQGSSVSERIFLNPCLSKNKKSLSSESSEGNTLKDTESIFTDIGDSPSRCSLNSKTDSNIDEYSLPCSPKQVSFTETFSEYTDVEQRVASLKRELFQRKQTARQLRIELKKKQRQELRARELALKQQLEEYDKKILEAQQQLGHSFSQDSESYRTPDSLQLPSKPEGYKGSVTTHTLTPGVDTPQQQAPTPAVSRTDSILEQLPSSHSGEQVATGTTVALESTPLEQLTLPLTSSAASVDRRQGNRSNTIQYSDTFLTSIEEGGSPDGAQDTSVHDDTFPLQRLRQERDKISDSLSAIMSTQLLSEMALSELDEKKFEAGDEVTIRDSLRGTVRYTGATYFADGIWVGVELREPVGTSNGTIKDVTYFECAPNHGVFVKPAKLCKLADNTEFDVELSAAESELESLLEEGSSHTHASFEPLVSVVSDTGPDRSITVLSETDSVGTAADDQTIRWSLESAELAEKTPTHEESIVQEIELCVSEELTRHSNETLVTSVTESLIREWARESVDIFLAVNSRRAPSLLHNVRPVLLQLPEEEVTTDEQSPLSPPQPPAISLELQQQSLLKIADSAVTFYRDRLTKQRPLDIGQLQFSRRSDTILPIAYNPADSPNKQAHHQIFRHFLFDLSYQVISELRTETVPTPVTLQPPKKKHRSFESRKLAYKSPREGEEATFVASQVSELIIIPTQLNNYQGKKEDPVEILLLKEMRAEEPDWIDYSQQEYIVKLEASDSIFESILEDALSIAMAIRRKRKRASLLF